MHIEKNNYLSSKKHENDHTQNKHKKYNTILTGYLYFITMMSAATMTMIGPVMPKIIAEHGLELSQGGLIMTLQSIGGVFSIILGGILADFIKKSKLIFISFSALGMILFVLIYINKFSLILVAFFVFGAANRMFDSISNAYMSDLHPANKALYLNLMHTIFGIGALSGPIYAGYLLDSGFSWNRLLSVAGITCIAVIALMPFLIKRDEKLISLNDSSITPGNPLQHMSIFGHTPLIWLLCIIMFLYIGHQSILVTWIPMFMKINLSSTTTLSGFALSSLWLGILLGRLTCAYLTYRIPVIKLLMIGSLLGGLVLGLGLLSQNITLLIISLGLAGLFSGATIPLIVTIACDRYPNNSGSATALIFLSGSLSSMIFPWLAGEIADIINFSMAMNISWVTLLAILLLGTWLNTSLKHE
jgi:fucose permease